MSPSAGIAHVMSPEQQRRLLLKQKVLCYRKMAEQENLTQHGFQPLDMCEIRWDTMLCWDNTPAGTTATKPCPDYVNGLNKNENATRYCTENATWYVPPGHETSWTNFTACLKPTIDVTFHKEVYARLRLMYSTGYSLSLGALVIAVIIMLFSRRLHCKSNTLHINLFLAFILRAAVSFLRDMLVKGVGLEQNVRQLPYGSVEVLEGSHWQCKLLFIVFNYSITTTFMWIFVEGLYLHLLVYKALLAERRGVKMYIVMGWVMPVILLIPWITVKALYENELCWTVQSNNQIFWMLNGPNVAIVVINFLSFLDVSRMLCLKTRQRTTTAGKAKYRKLAKFILVLIPLFGVTYIIFLLAFPTKSDNPSFNITHIYIEMAYSSFQGLVLAILFCFLNEEVNGELKRMWNRHQSRRSDAAALRKSFANSMRNSSRSSPGSERRGHLHKQGSSTSEHEHDQSDTLLKKALLTRAWHAIIHHDSTAGNPGKEAFPLTTNGSVVKDTNDNTHQSQENLLCESQSVLPEKGSVS